MAKSSLTLNKSSSRSLINTKKENPNAQFSYAPIQAKTDVRESENQDLSGYKQPQSRDIMENVTASPEQISNLGIQAKLTIGQPNDQYEQEADQVASQVVQQINTPAAVQRQEQGEEELQTKSEIQRQTDEEELQTKSEIQRQTDEEELQTKLEIQRQTDEEELQTKSEIQRQTDEEELQTKLEINPVSIQRKIGVNQLQKKPLISMLQRREAVQGGEASTDLESSINSAKGGGQSLDIGLQRSMGQAMGADFSGVRVHTDSNADQLSQSIQAKAFTTGNHIFMKQGEYNPSSQQGQELLAHELTHVVQQNSVSVQRKHEPQKANKVENIENGNQIIQRQLGVGNPIQIHDIQTVTKVHNKVWILDGFHNDSVVIKLEVPIGGENKQQFESRHAYVTWLATQVFGNIPNVEPLTVPEIGLLGHLAMAEGGGRGNPTLQQITANPLPNDVFLKVEKVAMGQNLSDKIQQAHHGGQWGQNRLEALIKNSNRLEALGKQAVFDLVTNNGDRFRSDGTVNTDNIDFTRGTDNVISIDNLDPNNRIDADNWPGQNKVINKGSRSGYAFSAVQDIFTACGIQDVTPQALKPYIIHFRNGMEQCVQLLKTKAGVLRLKGMHDRGHKQVIGNRLADRIDQLQV